MFSDQYIYVMQLLRLQQVTLLLLILAYAPRWIVRRRPSLLVVGHGQPRRIHSDVFVGMTILETYIVWGTINKGHGGTCVPFKV